MATVVLGAGGHQPSIGPIDRSRLVFRLLATGALRVDGGAMAHAPLILEAARCRRQLFQAIAELRGVRLAARPSPNRPWRVAPGRRGGPCTILSVTSEIMGKHVMGALNSLAKPRPQTSPLKPARPKRRRTSKLQAGARPPAQDDRPARQPKIRRLQELSLRRRAGGKSGHAPAAAGRRLERRCRRPPSSAAWSRRSQAGRRSPADANRACAAEDHQGQLRRSAPSAACSTSPGAPCRSANRFLSPSRSGRSPASI